VSFRLFIYYCALCGGWAAFFGWSLGLVIHPSNRLGHMGIWGMFLGLMVALGLGLVDTLWNLSAGRVGLIILRVGTGATVGAFGGLIGGLIGQGLLELTEMPVFFIFGWVLTGLLVGTSIGVFEVLSSIVRQRDLTGARGKLVKCLIGGTTGGFLGGTLAFMLRGVFHHVFGDRNSEMFWSPTAMGFVALGMCIGLFVGLAQVILKEAWIRIEAGFRPGRELILTKETTTIGRAESCDIGLFGDHGVEKFHAAIVQGGSRYYLEHAPTAAATFVNEQPVAGRVALKSGDLIRMGRSVLRFHERQKK
jgi:hypothetical protein